MRPPLSPTNLVGVQADAARGEGEDGRGNLVMPDHAHAQVTASALQEGAGPEDAKRGEAVAAAVKAPYDSLTGQGPPTESQRVNPCCIRA